MVFLSSLNIPQLPRLLAKVTAKLFSLYHRPIRTIMPAAMDPQTLHMKSNTAAMPYTHCKTRIVNLVDFDIPESGNETQYRQLYEVISRSKTPTAQALTDAISSVSTGIAPPVAFPTETVYGLGADATNPASISGIFAAKGRPSDNPLIVHVASQDHLERLTGEPIPAIYTDLVREHWPGPLTILIPVPKQNSIFAKNVHPGQKTIGFRVPESKYARFFIAATGRPIAAPSANSSGKPSPTTAQHVMDDLKGKINFILDGANCDVGVESTVVDGLHDPPLILRPGGLSQDDLIAHGKRYRNAWANVSIGYKSGRENGGAKQNGTTPEEAPRAPGMKYKHYAPQGQMILFDSHDSARKLQQELDLLLSTVMSTVNGSAKPEPDRDQSPNINAPASIAILTTTSWPAFANVPVTSLTSEPNNNVTSTALYGTHKIYSIPLGQDPKRIAQNLFAALRTCDDLCCRFILAEAPQRHTVQAQLKQKKKTQLGDSEINGESDGKAVQSKAEAEVIEQLYEFDAVLERMRKAASLVID